MNKHDDWPKAAGKACSFMRMYALALEISAEAEEQPLRQAADDVVSVLEGIIDRPIADAGKLKEARRRFTILMTRLADPLAEQTKARPAAFVLKMSMRR